METTEKLDPKLFRDYDIRGVVPWLVDKRSVYFGKVGKPETNLAPLDAAEAYVIARALAEYLKPKRVLVGRDTRLSADKFFEAFTHGLVDAGVRVDDPGVTTTSMVYFASGKYGYDATVNITASHTPREINGFKLTRENTKIIGAGSGMEELKAIALLGKFSSPLEKGKVAKVEILGDYVNHVTDLIEPSRIGRFKLVLDTSNGPMYRPLEKIIPLLNCEIVKLNFEPDGEFPAHDPNPLIPENREQVRQTVKAMRADLGVMWDGDADRIMFIDDQNNLVPGDFMTALYARYFLARNPGATVVYNAPSSWVVKDTVAKFGGRAVMHRTGHAFIKQKNREVDALFAGEHSAHYYFKHTYYAENDLIPFLAILDLMTEEKKSLSQLLKELGDYYVSGEINFEVQDREASVAAVKRAYRNALHVYFIDGVSVEFPDWHFNVRPSANDPVVRLNVETRRQKDLASRIEEVVRVIGGRRI